ncbi:LOW QUALITY PROTEIN: olfactory receptor 12D1 [Bos mutus]|uniref:LOW QUALITY PROTEIN: olfactory receptor 12D1 n=1 Tax=Bos mutus TaxID=72004 RepID=UPI0038B45FF7
MPLPATELEVKKLIRYRDSGVVEYLKSCFHICFSTVTLPKMLENFLSTHKAISFLGCISQLHFFHFLGSTESMLLAVMAFDRFVAICKPLHYTLIMNHQVCTQMAVTVWIIGFFHALLHSVMTSRLNFCGSNHIHHFFCDVKPLLEPILAACFHKALSTCASHFMVVVLLFGPVFFIYIRPASGSSMDQERIIAIMYSVVTPVLNPLIYTLRNKEVKGALKRVIRRRP